MVTFADDNLITFENIEFVNFLLQPKHKKKFIDKKNAVTFHLVHRSQHDPLVTDETAPQHVLVAEPPKEDKVCSADGVN